MIDFNRHRCPEPDEKYIIQRSPVPDRRRCRAYVGITNEEIVRARYPDEVIKVNMQHLQHQIGSGVIAQIWETGGVATVSLKATRLEDFELDIMRYCLEADVQPAATMTPVVKMTVPHFEYFPADWVCPYCGMLNDGVKYRRCPHCGGPKEVEE